MDFLIFDLTISFLVFLFVVYFFTHDDFVILRRDISTERIFNAAFLTAFFSLFCARIFYIFGHPSSVFFNFLGFLLFPYFPGLSLVEGVTGGFVFLFFYSQIKKMPFERLFDFFSMALLITMPIGILGSIFLNLPKVTNFQKIFLLIIIFVLALFLKFILPKTLSGKIKDGSLGFLFMSCFTFSFFVSKIMGGENVLIVLQDSWILIVIFASSLFFLLKKEFLKNLSFKNE